MQLFEGGLCRFEQLSLSGETPPLRLMLRWTGCPTGSMSLSRTMLHLLCRQGALRHMRNGVCGDEPIRTSTMGRKEFVADTLFNATATVMVSLGALGVSVLCARYYGADTFGK